MMKMINYKLTLGLILSSLLVANVASADETRFKYVGAQVDVGAPDGVGLGVVVRPKLNWLRLNLSGTYNAMAPGIRGGFTLDPIKFPIAPTFTLEGGHAFEGKVPGTKDLPSFSYDYLNLHSGLEFGNRDSVRFFIHAGPTYMNVFTSNFADSIGNVNKSISISDPTISARLIPTAKLGLVVLF
jgi:hypothetical protein